MAGCHYILQTALMIDPASSSPAQALPAGAHGPRLTATGTSYSFYVLGLLTLLYITNFVDRIVLGILVGPIQNSAARAALIRSFISRNTVSYLSRPSLAAKRNGCTRFTRISTACGCAVRMSMTSDTNWPS